jgi:hypothetical protein
LGIDDIVRINPASRYPGYSETTGEIISIREKRVVVVDVGAADNHLSIGRRQVAVKAALPSVGKRTAVVSSL